MQRLNTTHHTPCKEVALQRLFRANRGHCMQRLFRGMMLAGTIAADHITISTQSTLDVACNVSTRIAGQQYAVACNG
jgi:hypothetical protein